MYHSFIAPFNFSLKSLRLLCDGQFPVTSQLYPDNTLPHFELLTQPQRQQPHIPTERAPSTFSSLPLTPHPAAFFRSYSHLGVTPST